MTLWMKNYGYAFLISLDAFYVIMKKEFQLLQVLNELSVKDLIKLILYETM